MGQQLFRLLALLACLLGAADQTWSAATTSGLPESAAAAVPAATTPILPAKPAHPLQRQYHWQDLTPAQQHILAPVQSRWLNMSTVQRKRLLAVAAKYPQFKPEEQQRFQKRLTTWSALTPAQRDLARRNYKKLKQLPPTKQLAVKQKWLQSHQATAVPASPIHQDMLQTALPAPSTQK